MSMTTTSSRVEGEDVAVATMPTLGWALRRAALGIFILTFAIAGAAWLFYASIEPVDANSAPARLVAPAQDLPNP